MGIEPITSALPRQRSTIEATPASSITLILYWKTNELSSKAGSMSNCVDENLSKTVEGTSRCESVVSGCEDEGRYHVGEKQEVSNVTACRKDARHSPTWYP